MKGEDADWAQRDLVEAIERFDYPKWSVKVQVMTEEQAKTFKWNPFDLTKVWPHGDFPLIDVGVMELNKIPDNYFADVEQSAFAPAHVVDGIGYSPDRMLQGRLLSYPDAHRYRLGVNYEQLPVNRCPYAVNNYERDGAMRLDGNAGSAPNYFPNSFDNIKPDPAYQQLGMNLDSQIAAVFDRNAPGEDDHYTQPGIFYREVLTAGDKTALVNNIVGAMKGISTDKKQQIIMRQLCHFFRADMELGMRIAQGLALDMAEVMSNMPQAKKEAETEEATA
jgi:catalase